MNILIAGGFDFPDGKDGATQLIRSYAKGFVNLGNEVSFLLVGRQKENLPLHGTLDGFEYRYIKGSKFLSWLPRIVRYIHSILLISMEVWRKRAKRIDTILLYQTPLHHGIWFFLLGKLLIIPVAYLYADYYNYIRAKDIYPSLLVRLNSQLGVTILPRIVDLNIVLSQYLYNMLSKVVLPNRILLLTSTVDCERFHPELQPHPLVKTDAFGGREKIVYLGSFLPHQNVEGLIKSARRLESRRKEIVFIIAGCLPEDRMRACQKLATELGLNDFVVFPGCIPPEEVPCFLAGADILVSPRDNSPTSVAAGPMKIAEYLASGRPVVSTRAGDIVNLAVDRKDLLFCESEDCDSLATAITELLDNDKLAIRLAQSGRELAIRNFSNVRLCQSMMAAFSKIQKQ